MDRKMRFLFAAFIMITLVNAQASPVGFDSLQGKTKSTRAVSLQGRWQVKFSFSGLEKNLILVAKAKGSGTFLLLDTEPGNLPAANPSPAVWSRMTNDRVSFSGEAELPLGTCCREIGTLIFKGRFTSPNAIAGKLVFVTSVDEDESPYRLHSLIGTFAASRVN